IDYPVAIDSDYGIWRAFDNEYWPALYLIDAQGRIRHHRFGEGGYDEAEQAIRQLLMEAGSKDIGAEPAVVKAEGIEAPASWGDLQSPETYVGYARTENFASPGRPGFDKRTSYAVPSHLGRNQWALSGEWTVAKQVALLNKANGRIAFRFHARDLHLVM